MSLLHYLQPQPIDSETEDSDLNRFEEDTMSLEDTINPDVLSQSWSEIVTDIESDPSWQEFYSEDE